MSTPFTAVMLRLMRKKGYSKEKLARLCNITVPEVETLLSGTLTDEDGHPRPGMEYAPEIDSEAHTP